MEFLAKIEIARPPDAAEVDRERIFTADLLAGQHLTAETMCAAKANSGVLGELEFV